MSIPLYSFLEPKSIFTLGQGFRSLPSPCTRIARQLPFLTAGLILMITPPAFLRSAPTPLIAFHGTVLSALVLSALGLIVLGLIVLGFNVLSCAGSNEAPSASAPSASVA